jgi:hypothetical protein
LPQPAILGPDSVCAGSSCTFTANNQNYSVYTWTYSTGGTFTGNNTPAITGNFTGQGVKTINLSVIDNHGCKNSANTHSILVMPSPIPSITGENPVCCNAYWVEYQTVYHPNKFFWAVDNGDFMSDNDKNSVLIHWSKNNPPSYSITVEEKTPDLGCKGTYTLNVDVIPGDCAPDTIDIILNGVNVLVCPDPPHFTHYSWYRKRIDGTTAAEPNTNCDGYSFCQFANFDPATYYYYVVFSNGNGCETMSYYNFHPHPHIIGIEEQQAIDGFTLFPNPNQGNFRVEMISQYQGPLEVSVLDATGRQVGQYQLFKPSLYFTKSFSLPGLTQGLYIVKISSRSGFVSSEKMIVQ